MKLSSLTRWLLPRKTRSTRSLVERQTRRPISRRSVLSVLELEPRTLLSTIPFEFNVPQDVASQPGGVYMALYGQLAANYGGLTSGTNVYLKNTGPNTYDYAATMPLGVGTNVPVFLSTSTALTNVQVDIPDVLMNSARVVIGVGAQPILQVNDANGDITAPTPSIQGTNIYDFFEFSYLPNGVGTSTLTINTSAIDQFGFPIKLEASTVSPPGSGPSQVGVQVSRPAVLGPAGDFLQFVTGTAFEASAMDPFGGISTTRLISPADILADNGVTGVTAAPDANGNMGTLTGPLYYYAVSALKGANEAYLGDTVVQGKPSTLGSVLVSWAPPTAGSPVTSYNVYRGTISGNIVTWQLAGNTTAVSGQGGSYLDQGTNTSNQQPPFDPLSTYFDTTINDLFNKYVNESLVLTVTDGSVPANGLQYTLTGRTVANPLSQYDGTTGNTVLEFTCTAIANNPQGITPLIPLTSKFYVYKPFFSTNTYDPSNPSPPTWTYSTHGPSSMPDTAVTASGMVWSAEGAFADNSEQALVIPYLPFQPAGLNANAYSVALGSIENQLNAALTRGIALRMNFRNWGNAAPTNVQAAPNNGGSLTQTYYYVVTTLNQEGESTVSNEVSFTPQGTTHSVFLSWTVANSLVNATGYNIYRGTARGEENQLIASVSSSTFQFLDAGTGYATGFPLAAYSPPTYYPGGNAPPTPSGVAATPSTGGSLATTYYYVVTALDTGGESVASNEATFVAQGTNQSVLLTWNSVANATGYNVYRGTRAGQENQLIASVTTTTYQDMGSGYALGYPRLLGTPAAADLYAQFFHQTAISIGGLAYASPYDDQSNQSSTITVVGPLKVKVTLGSWTTFITPNPASLEQGQPLLINGGGFDLDSSDNSVTLSSGVGTVTGVNATGTQLTVTFTTPPALGALTATVATINGGNSGPVQVATIVPDSVGPAVGITSSPALNTVSKTAQFTFAGTDNGSPSAQLEYLVNLDGAGFTSNGQATSKTYTGLGVGMHTFRVQAKDLAGNVSAPAAYTWTITTAARIVIQSGAGQFTTVGTPYAQPIVATAEGPSGNPVADALVFFLVTPSALGAAATLTSAFSNSAGTVVITATANMVAGSYSAKALSGAATSAPFTLTNVVAPPASLSAPLSQTFTGDFNGDNREDVAAITEGGQWLVGLSDGTTFTTTQWAQWSIPATWYQLFVGDFNGDSRDDIAGMATTGSWFVGLSDGTGSFVTGTAWATWSIPAVWRQLFIGDFNGDNQDDIAGKATHGTWWVGLSNGTSFATPTQWETWSASFVWHQLFIGDFNADGREDIAGFAFNGTWWVGLSDGSRFNTLASWATWSAPAIWHQLFIGDFNADGRDDVAGFAFNGTWWVGLSNGTNSFALAAAPWATWSGPTSWYQLFIGDFNADGRADVAGFGVNGQWWVGLSNGTTAFTVAAAPWDTWAIPAKWQTLLVSDFNNDGFADVGGFDVDRRWWVGRSNGSLFATELWASWT